MIGCKQCGRCCKNVTFWELCNDEDWKLINDFFMMRNEGIVDISIPHHGKVIFDIQGFDTRSKLEKGEADLYWSLDEFNCLFIRYVRDNKGRFKGKYYCPFHGTEAKPTGCREFPLKHGDKHAKKFCGCKYFED